jgi:hypothetical protein
VTPSASAPPAPRRPTWLTSSSRSGHTILNLVILLGLVSVGARLAWPATLASWHLSQARELVQMVRDVQAAAEATAEAATRDAASPENAADRLTTALRGAPLGEIPESLAPQLPADMTFQTPDYRLGWSWWRYGETVGRLIEGPGVGTLTVEIRDPGVLNAFLRLARESVWYTAGNSVTFLIPLADGPS